MYMNNLIYILAFACAFACACAFAVLPHTVRENFDTYGSCVAQGYNFDWCLRAPVDVYDTDSMCWCPPGQKIYKRYGRCYCQTYTDNA